MKCLGGQLIHIIYFADRHDGKGAQAGANDQGLGIVIADNPDTLVALQFGQVGFEFGSKVVIFNIMDRPGKVGAVFDRQSAAFGAKVRMVIGSVEKVIDTILSADTAEQTAHNDYPPVELIKIKHFNFPTNLSIVCCHQKNSAIRQ
jgi:hypothetical protein